MDVNINTVKKYINKNIQFWIERGKKSKGYVYLNMVEIVLIEYQHMLEFLKILEKQKGIISVEEYIHKKADFWIEQGKKNNGVFSLFIVNSVLVEYQQILEFLKKVKKEISKNEREDDFVDYFGECVFGED